MSIPSITIRLDFGEGGSAGGTVQQGAAPSPVVLAGLGTSAAPMPSGDPSAMAAAQAAPAPSGGAPGLAGGAGAPPSPSPDIPGLPHRTASAGDAAPPRPEGDPTEKKPGRK